MKTDQIFEHTEIEVHHAPKPGTHAKNKAFFEYAVTQFWEYSSQLSDMVEISYAVFMWMLQDHSCVFVIH